MNSQELDIGIAIMAYNRPKHLSKVLDELKNNHVDKFSVYMDGADDRLIRMKQDEIVGLIQRIDWAEINFVRRPINMGLRRSIVSAVNDELSKHEAIILLEDDCPPKAGFFDYMIGALKHYRNHKKVRSVCGYQFPHLSDTGERLIGRCISRFIPWGWATWRDRWVDYDTDLRHLITQAHETGTFASLPSDVRHYLDSKLALDDGNDIWSINWVLTHYISRTFCLFPSRTLVENIGFDGTGVHCFETNAFSEQPSMLSKDQKKPEVEFIHPPVYDSVLDRHIIDYMESHWNKTMVVTDASNENSDIKLSSAHVGQSVQQILNQTPIVDVHTHLFPDDHAAFSLSGLDELLTYHYLTVETLTVTGIDPGKFFSMNKSQQAQFVWDELFRIRTPLSEATKGVVTALNFFGVEVAPISYDDMKIKFSQHKLSSSDLMDRLNIKQVVMTNDPFDDIEWNLFESDDWCRNRYRSALRLDTLFSNPERAAKEIARTIEDESAHVNGVDAEQLKRYLSIIKNQSKPAYTALSVDGNDLTDISEHSLFINGIIPWCEKNRLPLALMLGVKRGVNPAYGLGGDGVGGDGLDELERLIKAYPNVQFLVTHLLDNAQHAVAVLARKLPNLKLFGHWWFVNQPSLIQQTLRMRFDLLGTGFIPQHSDARVLEQLVFKWIHFKQLLQEILTERYRALIRAGWPVDEDMIRRDLYALLYENSINSMAPQNYE